MNLRELFEPNLTELNMSPTNLRALAAKTQATVGIEYEMILKGYRETDNGADQKVRSFSDIEDFFGQINSGSSMNRVIDRLETQIEIWVGDQAQNNFESVQGERWFVKWLRENVRDSYIQGALGLESDQPIDYEQFAEHCRTVDTYWFNQAFDEYVQEQMVSNSKFSQENFLKERGLTTMSAVYDEFQSDLEMPSGLTQATYEEVALAVERVLGKKAKGSDTYHGVARDRYHYIVEPDSSITPESETYDLPVEIVSPPQSVTAALADYRKLKSWALMNNHYTNQSTGLHINVSLPLYDADVDWTKLVLLSGDEYVLQQFGRLNNQYASNALDLIRRRLEINKDRTTPEIKDAVLNLVASKMDQLAEMIASRLMRLSHLSVVVKANHIEFRSPGGDWLKYEPEVIENTVYRYVVALDAAMSPDKYREDYLKKMYQLVKGGKQSELTMGLFKYHRGFMTKEEFQKMLQTHYQTGLPKPAQARTPAQTPVLTELFEKTPEHSALMKIPQLNQMVSWFFAGSMAYAFTAEYQSGAWRIEFKMIEPEFESDQAARVQRDPYAESVWDLLVDQGIELGATKMQNIGFAHGRQVIGTIIKIFEEFMRKEQPKRVEFTAKTEERGRVNLYRRLSKMAAMRYNYRADEYLQEPAITWELIKK